MRRILYLPEDYERIARFIANKMGTEPETDKFTAIGIEKDGQIIAGVVYSNWNGKNIHASIAGTGKRWLDREFLWFMFYYPFEQLGVKRITVCVEQANIVSQHFVAKLGFLLEFCMKDAGRTGDLLIYRLFKKECRFLERRRNGKRQLAPASP